MRKKSDSRETVCNTVEVLYTRSELLLQRYNTSTRCKPRLRREGAQHHFFGTKCPFIEHRVGGIQNPPCQISCCPCQHQYQVSQDQTYLSAPENPALCAAGLASLSLSRPRLCASSTNRAPSIRSSSEWTGCRAALGFATFAAKQSVSRRRRVATAGRMCLRGHALESLRPTVL